MKGIEERWNKHAAVPFPEGLRGREVAGVNLTVLESELSACVLTAIETGGVLGIRMRGMYDAGVSKLAEVIPQLSGEAQAYFRNLQSILEELEGKLQKAS